MTGKEGGTDPTRASVPDEDRIFRWVRDLYAFGVAERYGYRMPGTAADHAAARYLAAELAALGLADVQLEPVPLAVAFPEKWSLDVHGLGLVPCCFIRYAGYTPPHGVTAPLAHVGAGTSQDFDRIGVEGRIVVVDLATDGVIPPMGRTYFEYDPEGVLADLRGGAAWPVRNLASSYDEAFRRGAAGWIGILHLFGDDTNEYLHWYARFELPALTVSHAAGHELLARARAGAEATIVLTGTRGQGTGLNIYGTIPGRCADEFIVLKSHYDGWATNEASGAAVTLGAAAGLLRGDLERSVLVFFRSSHFGVSWSLGPDSWHVPRHEAAAIYGLRPDWANYACRALSLAPYTAVANNIEMIGRRFLRAAAGWTPAEQPAPRLWGLTGPEDGANAILLSAVSGAIVRHGLAASQVSNFLVGDGWDYVPLGVPLVNFISHNVWQFTRKDTLDTVYKPDLARAAAAFVDIVRAEDEAPFLTLRPVSNVCYQVKPGGEWRTDRDQSPRRHG